MKNNIFIAIVMVALLLVSGCHKPDELLPSTSRDGINSITATFEDGTTETVTDYSIGYPDMTTTGMKTIIVSLNRNGIVAQITYEINIYELSKKCGLYKNGGYFK